MLLFRLLFVALLASGPAFADCTAPTAPAGTLDYFAANKTSKFCDGADWVGVAQCGTSLGACTTAGTLDYDASIQNFKLCDGVNWVPVANTKTLGACATAGQMDYDATEKTFKSCHGSHWKAWATVGGLVGHWKLDDGTGSATAADASGSGNTGTLTNMTPVSDWVAGRVGSGALDFDGVNDVVDVADVLNMGTSDWSYAGWFYYTDTDSGFPVAKTTGWAGYSFYVNWEERAACGYDNSPDSFQADAMTAAGFVQTNRWYHFACVHDRDGDLTLYMDGKNEASVSIAADNGHDVNHNAMLRIGRRNQSTTFDYFTGLIDDVRIYNRALSAAEVSALYNGGAGCQ